MSISRLCPSSQWHFASTAVWTQRPQCELGQTGSCSPCVGLWEDLVQDPNCWSGDKCDHCSRPKLPHYNESNNAPGVQSLKEGCGAVRSCSLPEDTEAGLCESHT
ncbi:hypothetical protein GDO81_023597 [Engystomops pustulosus]|uniref:TNFR-Cys domain-containing protein n=1 Tax=Engystomops pustulosus TaxID=76066 RepID=A0AAV6Z8Z8_ENGPU|nr:hypothetical protein GDO81_023597 [Engystomops pustulosus]